MRPERCARSVGSTARCTLRMPNTLVSNTARAAASLASSTADSKPRPALLTTTSMRPNRCDGRFDRRGGLRLVEHVERHRSNWSPASGNRAVMVCGSRAVATTECPAASAFSTISAPKPLEAPVTNQTLIDPFLSISNSGAAATPAIRVPVTPCGRCRAARRGLGSSGQSPRHDQADGPGASPAGRQAVRRRRIRRARPPRPRWRSRRADLSSWRPGPPVGDGLAGHAAQARRAL